MPLDHPDSQAKLREHAWLANALPADDFVRLAGLVRCRRYCPARTRFIEAGQRSAAVHLLDVGWAVTHCDLADGRRQVVDVRIPGDLVGLRALWFPSADVSVSAITDLNTIEWSARDLRDAAAAIPDLGRLMAGMLARDAAIMTQRLAAVGRRSAYEATAFLLWELWQRTRQRGLAHGPSYPCPLSQTVIADLLGLSVVHVNRSLRQLARDGVATKHASSVAISDPESLAGIADADPAYLDI